MCKVFHSWLLRNQLQFQGIPHVLRFFQDGVDRGLALNTLKVQAATLSVSLESTIAGEPLVVRYFQSVARCRPPPLRVCAQLDLSLDLKSLVRAPFEPLGEVALRYPTLKTVFLIAITTPRRVSDLQALLIILKNLKKRQPRVLLRVDPAFLPKVASSFYRTQEIVLQTFVPRPSDDGKRFFHCLDAR